MMRGRGFTLMEVLVAAALSAVVVFLVSLAIRTTLHSTDARRAQIEEARLARAVLQRMADDLRATVQYKAVDFGGVENLAALGSLDEMELDPNALPTGEEAEEPTSVASQFAPPPAPGLYGTRYELQIDVSRLPRVEEYNTLIYTDARLTDLPSDIKTVAYYLQQGSALGSANPLNANGPGGEATAGASGQAADELVQEFNPNENRLPHGLVRRSLDRSITLYALESGAAESLDTVGQVLAPEVVALEFRYTDGQSWYDEWDTNARGGLPLAVQIAVALSSARPEKNDLNDPFAPIDLFNEQLPLASAASNLGPQTSRDVQVYRLTVSLPMAEPPTPEEEELDMETLAP